MWKVYKNAKKVVQDPSHHIIAIIAIKNYSEIA